MNYQEAFVYMLISWGLLLLTVSAMIFLMLKHKKGINKNQGMKGQGRDPM